MTAPRPGPAATGLTDEFRAACETLDSQLSRLRGLLFAANHMSLDLDGDTFQAAAVGVLIETAEVACEAAQNAKDCAWRAQGGS